MADRLDGKSVGLVKGADQSRELLGHDEGNGELLGLGREQEGQLGREKEAWRLQMGWTREETRVGASGLGRCQETRRHNWVSIGRTIVLRICMRLGWGKG